MLLHDIGEGSNALFCLTTRVQCCTAEAGGVHGDWRFPDDKSDMSIPSSNSIRGYSSVLLNVSAVMTTGIFTCTIPDQANSTAVNNLYIGLYDNSDEGEISYSTYVWQSQVENEHIPL